MKRILSAIFITISLSVSAAVLWPSGAFLETFQNGFLFGNGSIFSALNSVPTFNNRRLDDRSKDIFFQEDFEGASVSFTCGANLVASDDSSTPLNESVSKVVTQSTGALGNSCDSANITLSEKQKGTLLSACTTGKGENFDLVAYDVTNSNELARARFTNINESVCVVFNTLATTDNLQYRIESAIEVDATEVKFDDVIFKTNPLEPTDIFASSGWVNDGATVITGVTSDPTKGTIVRDNVYWRRVGDSAEVRIEFEQSSVGTTGSGEYLIRMPSGLKIDTTKVHENTGGVLESIVGQSHLSNAPSGANDTSRHGVVKVYDEDNVVFMHKQTNLERMTSWGSAAFSLNSSNLVATARFTVPIAGWSDSRQGVVVKTRTDNAAYENVFSARVANNGTATLTSQNVDWLDAGTPVTRNFPGDVTLNFKSDLFSVTPTCQAITETAGAAAVDTYMISISTTGVRFNSYNYGLPGGQDFDIEVICQRQGTDYIQEVDRVNVVPVTELAGNTVRAFGFSGTTLTASATDIPWATEVLDAANAWNGTQYTVQQDNSIVSISGAFFVTTNQAQVVDIYKNGVSYQRVLFCDTCQDDYFDFTSSRGEFNAGDVLTFRSGFSRTLATDLSSPFATYLNINEEYEPSGLLVSADVTNVTEQVSRPGDLNTFFNEEMNTITTGEVVTGAGTFPSGGTFVGTIAKETVNPLSGTESFRFQQLAGSTGSFIAFPAVTVQPKNRNNLVEASVFTSFSGIDNSVDFVVYDNTNGAELGRVPIRATAQGKEHTLLFNMPSNTASVTYGFQVALVDDGSILLIDDVEFKVDPLAPTEIYASSEWESSGAITIEGVSSNPTKGTIVKDEMKWRRVGDSIEIIFDYQQSSAGSAGSGDYLFSIPSGYQIDLNKLEANNTADATTASVVGVSRVGNGIGDGIANQATGHITVYDATRFRVVGLSASGAVVIQNVSSTFLSFADSVLQYSGKLTVPIQGWSNTSQGVVVKNRTDSASVENVFSAKIAAGGSVSDENVDWINGNCTSGSTPICTYVSGLFTTTPNCTITAVDANTNNTNQISAQSSVSITITKVADRAFNITCVRQGTDYIKETDKVYTVPVDSLTGNTVRGEGNGNSAVTGSTTPVTFNEITDTANAWDGDEYTVQKNNSKITLSGEVKIASNETNFLIDLYKNNTNYKQIGREVSSGSDTATFSYDSARGEFVAGDVLEIRLVNGATLSNSFEDHHISINEEYGDRGVFLGTFGQPTCYVKDVKVSGTNGGTATSGSYETRDLNTISGNCSFLSLSSNQITLKPGSYDVSCKAPAYYVGQHNSILYDATNTDRALTGSSEYSPQSTNQSQTSSLIEGNLNINSDTIYEVRTRVAGTNATFGHGNAHSFGDEVYTQCKITKVR